MESLLNRAPTILDHVDSWWAGVCECGAPIDVSWAPEPADVEGFPEDHVWIQTHCPECVCRNAPDPLRPAFDGRYLFLRAQRVSLGLGSDVLLPDVAPSDIVRQSLGWQEDAITLYAGTWRRPGRGAAGSLLMDQFFITGTMAASRAGTLDRDAVAPRPWFYLDVLHSPGRPGELMQFARVLLGLTISDQTLPGIRMDYAWNAVVPAALGDFILSTDVEMPPYSWARIRKFSDDALGLIQAHAASGRPRGKGGYIKTREEFKAAVFTIVSAIVSQSRDAEYRPTYKEIGREIHKAYRPAGKTPLKDPGKSFTDLCKTRGLKPKELVDRAVAACAKRE